ncbi:HesA/MoeB/ThiF family protein [Tissierella creatinophila]|uniref:Molybdopterin-synthase adenylyltransferase n=1 Tax=Tissierella creatinophila DSM 6911 TaxID=1123403 RepID=A0A1U7M958_TISCR|nr:ThiF family adenylyltransferase [Tissierella creatinophila]OLS03738.1 molybdopterin-synthase adenylyltransferase [Tissierella creatinophila DSM 6911]
MERYKRNYTSISKEEQKLLSNISVAIVGLGGLGGYVLENLVRLGVRNFNLIDKDVFDTSNLNRQLLATEKTLNNQKAKEAFNRALEIDHEVKAKIFCEKLDEHSIKMLEGVDIVVDCLDSISTRLILESLCDKMSLTLIHGAIRGYYGQVSISRDGDRVIKKIYKKDIKEDESLGNLPMTCMVTASLQVNLLLKTIFKESLEHNFILIDVKNMDIEKINI